MSQPIILIVDDEPIVTSMLGMILDLSLAAKVLTTNSSPQARDILQQGQVSLLITDYLMPELNGLNLIRGLRERGSTIPVLLLTGYCDEPELAANTEILRPFEVIVKPWSNEHLVQRINFWLSSSIPRS
jgi:two-component system response regulator FixJ